MDLDLNLESDLTPRNEQMNTSPQVAEFASPSVKTTVFLRLCLEEMCARVSGDDDIKRIASKLPDADADASGEVAMLRNGLALFLQTEAAAKERKANVRRKKAERRGGKLSKSKARSVEREEEAARRYRLLKLELEEGGGERLLAQ